MLVAFHLFVIICPKMASCEYIEFCSVSMGSFRMLYIYRYIFIYLFTHAFMCIYILVHFFHYIYIYFVPHRMHGCSGAFFDM